MFTEASGCPQFSLLARLGGCLLWRLMWLGAPTLGPKHGSFLPSQAVGLRCCRNVDCRFCRDFVIILACGSVPPTLHLSKASRIRITSSKNSWQPYLQICIYPCLYFIIAAMTKVRRKQ
ncbi:hypothetical protein E2320_004141, partial [Naja naja]